MKEPSLAVRIGSISFRYPVTVASGTFGYANEAAGLLNLKKLGAIVTKTITLKPREGNPAPRTCETPSGMLNSVGLENPGIDRFISEKLPFLRSTGVPVIISIAAQGGWKEFPELARRLELPGVSGIELNISCPNIKEGNSPDISKPLISQDARETYKVVSAVRKVTAKTLITKLTPNVTNITEIAESAQDAGSDGLAMVNTFAAMSIDIKKRKASLGGITGGLSGPAIRPIAVKMVWETFKKVNIPIIAMGGITDPQSALEFFIAGASVVSVGTGNFINPSLAEDIISGLRHYLKQNRMHGVKKLIGSLT